MSRFEVPLVMLRSRYLKLIHWRSAAILVGTPFVMIMSMCAMLPMHEDMEYRTSQNEKPRQPAQSVSTMLRDEVKGGDCEKAIEGDAARCKLGSLSVTARLPIRVLVHIAPPVSRVASAGACVPRHGL